MGAMACWGRGLGLMTAVALVVGLTVMPGSEAVAAPAPLIAAEFGGLRYCQQLTPRT
jgi:hypothetical protein